ncbi:L-rhamnose mutarotase [Erwinia sp. E602]|uniref:L-rhamnose mutarotase n=1 Tax=Erwinia sp. E602 TaxID=2675378 RepID=UPI001BAA7381|nr:L-rhamnose mutarotase [Erwinia sp. E602]QUG75306.1 L-rhamnose mutarotase [Erwinia sp. E602]
MSGGKRFVQALDLQDDPQLIAEYRQHHQRIWPEIAAHLRQHGILSMEIYLLGTRLVMVMETGADYDAAAFNAASLGHPKVQEWEALMWRYQCATPWTPDGEKWVPMENIFSLTDQP